MLKLKAKTILLSILFHQSSDLYVLLHFLYTLTHLTQMWSNYLNILLSYQHLHLMTIFAVGGVILFCANLSERCSFHTWSTCHELLKRMETGKLNITSLFFFMTKHQKLVLPDISVTYNVCGIILQCCSICFEPWTNSGNHRLASLKCGHLFGLG